MRLNSRVLNYTMMKKFNVAVAMPEPIRVIFNSLNVRLAYSNHALQQALVDRYGPISSLPQMFLALDWSLVEAEVEDGAVVKFVARRPLNSRLDLVVVIIPDVRRPGGWFVKTVWQNLHSDNHASLRWSCSKSL